MKKVKVSWDGRNNNETWHVLQWQDVGEPHLTLERHRRELQVTFESARELERFIKGIALCRARFEDDGKICDIFLTPPRTC